jgi:aryl-alcohol dehydrogenase-like predicted oxidoreductase
MYVKDKIWLGLAVWETTEYINIRIQYYDKSQEALRRMLLVFLILLPIKHGIRYFGTAPSYGKGGSS